MLKFGVNFCISRNLYISSKFSNLLAHNYSYYFLIIHFTFVRLVVNFSFIPGFSNLSLLFIFLSFFFFFSWSVCASNPHLLTFNPKNLAGFFVSYNNIFIDVLEFSILTVSQNFFSSFVMLISFSSKLCLLTPINN